MLPYHRFGTGKYEFLGRVYDLDDFTTPSDESVQRLQAIIDEAFGRSKKGVTLSFVISDILSEEDWNQGYHSAEKLESLKQDL